MAKVNRHLKLVRGRHNHRLTRFADLAQVLLLLLLELCTRMSSVLDLLSAYTTTAKLHSKLHLLRGTSETM